MREGLRRFRSRPSALIGLLFLGLVFLVAILGPWLSSHTYHDLHLTETNSPPSWKYWFGSDELGRDIFVRTCYGARISLFIGFTAALIDLIIGVIWGGIAAYAGGAVDELLMRIADILYALPYLLVVILLIVLMGPGIGALIVAMTLTGWINTARLVRTKLLQIKCQPFILAARSTGLGPMRILFGHLIPNAIGPMIAMMTLTVPVAIFTEAFLSFIGLGVQAPIASWGTMVNDALPALCYYPWRLLFPAALLTGTLLALYLVSDGIRDLSNPHL
jgi:oligopeptide transport system permease protein